MGRQPHVVRLALGRSPFQDPLRDENGDFVLGPHAHDNDAPGYHQQFDDHGHPQNRTSRAKAKRLQKAQNDVLATVGVVVKKGEERKSYWERLHEDQKQEILLNENQTGGWLQVEDRVLGIVTSWPITSIRRRLMTLNPYFSVPVTNLAIKEYRLMSPMSFLFPGLTFHLASGLPVFLRHYAFIPNPEMIVNSVGSWRKAPKPESTWYFLFRQTVRTLLRAIELPLLTHGTLQSLFIIPNDQNLSWMSFVPFSSLSPIMLPPMPINWNGDSVIGYFSNLLGSPLILYLARDLLQTELGYRIYAMLRQLIPKPDKPDTASARAMDEKYLKGEAILIAGLGRPWSPAEPGYERGKRHFGPKSFFGILRLTFPLLFRALNMYSKGRLARSRGRLTPLLDRQLRHVIRERYWYDRDELTPLPRRGSPDDIAFRYFIVYLVFKAVNLDPVEELVDVNAWINDVLGPKADVIRVQAPVRHGWDDEPMGFDQYDEDLSRVNTEQYSEAVSNVIAEAFRVIPSSDAVIIQALNGELVVFGESAPTETADDTEMDNIRTLQATEIPLQAVVQGMRNLRPSAEQVPYPEQQPPPPSPTPPVPATHEVELQRTRTQSPPPPSAPTPGITRARSLTDSQVPNSPVISLRPIRRPTETDESLAVISEALQSPRPSSPGPAWDAGHQEGRQQQLHDNNDSWPQQPPHQVPWEQQAETLLQTIENRDQQQQHKASADPPLTPLKLRHFRVTMLSNHAADSLAWHASAVLTSLLLWPVEAMWLRSLARWALSNPAMSPSVDPWWAARLGLCVLEGRAVTVFGLGAWFGGARGVEGPVRYAGGILITLGLEALVRGIGWGFGVWRVMNWKDTYGWGQF